MKPFIVLLVVFLMGNGVLIGVSVAEGYLLHWMIPSLDLNFSILAGAIFTIASLYFFAQIPEFMQAANIPSQLIPGDDEEDEDDDDEEDEAYEPRPPARFRRRPRRKR